MGQIPRHLPKNIYKLLTKHIKSIQFQPTRCIEKGLIKRPQYSRLATAHASSNASTSVSFQVLLLAFFLIIVIEAANPH